MNYYYTQTEAFLIALILCVLSIPAAFSAVKRKNRSTIWVFLTFLFPPFFFVVEALSNKSVTTIKMLACEACQKEISAASQICPHCGHPNHLVKKIKASFYEWFVGILMMAIIIFEIIYPPTFMINGFPSCDASFTQNLAQNTIKKIPLIHNWGISSIDFKNIQEVETTADEKKCKALIRLSNDTEHTVLYTISKQPNSKIYLQVQLVD